ncbi:hypothetical protein CCMSSC00406_0002763 [Pleurotus cornucopiae]|uniref:Uncharacterized protein n=1 Tax=Pleurotus cornucopiae TaxID=5321 RepID=A0ACB7IW29_PLECO|nr:hypothetical protein CCMSSC00406_0002763 [Pleurotus cornucopiae]
MAPTSKSRLGPPSALMLPDTLTIIFECLVLDDDDDDFPRFDKSTPCDDWFPATHTCQTWRKVAIATTRIWGCIWTAMPPNLTRLFLQRSKSIPLCLYACGHESNEDTVSMVLDTHAARLQVVQMMDFHPKWIVPLFEMPTPQLESITLTGYIEPDEWDDPEECQRCSFSATTLHEGIPSLKYLSISGFGFELDSPLLSNLTDLNMSFHESDGPPQFAARFAPDELLRALRSMPRLLSLDFYDVLEPGSPIFRSPVALILPVLRRLKFHVEPMLDFDILRYLTLPAIQHIDLQCGRVAEPTDIATVVPIIRALLPPHDSSLTQTTVLIEASRHDGKPQSRPELKVKMKQTDKPPVDLAFALVGTKCFQTEDPLHMFHPLLGPIESFEFDGYAEVQQGTEPAAFVPFFRAMSEVTELLIHGLDDITFALFDTPKPPKKKGVRVPYALPSLKKISLYQARDLTDTENLVGRVRKLLLARKALGAPIDVLEIVLNRGYKSTTKSKVTPQDLKPLTKVVQVVFMSE